MSATRYSDVVKGRPSEASSSSDMNSWMKTFQQENEDEALKIVLDMSKVRSFKQLVHCFLYLRFSKCNASGHAQPVCFARLCDCYYPGIRGHFSGVECAK